MPNVQGFFIEEFHPYLFQNLKGSLMDDFNLVCGQNLKRCIGVLKCLKWDRYQRRNRTCLLSHPSGALPFSLHI
jgi:hypothetical protein